MSSGPLEVLVPTVRSVHTELRRAPRAASLDGKTLGFLSNSKPGADVLLRELADLLSSRHHVQTVFSKKTNGGLTAGEAILFELSTRCYGIVTGIGN